MSPDISLATFPPISMSSAILILFEMESPVFTILSQFHSNFSAGNTGISAYRHKKNEQSPLILSPTGDYSSNSFHIAEIRHFFILLIAKYS